MTFQLQTFHDTSSAENLGSKAHRLGILYREGFPVPFGVILPPKAFEQFLGHHPELRKAISGFIQSEHESVNNETLHAFFATCDLPDSLLNTLAEALSVIRSHGFAQMAVRSSGTLEDGLKTSFAGQFDTFLHISTHEELAQAVKQCWLSMYGERVMAYCRHHTIAPEKMAMSVLIQGQIDAEYSGVVFTANPMTGNDKEMIMEVVEGMGEALVQGSVTPYRYHYQWFDEQVSSTSEDASVGLSTQQIKTLGDMCLKIQQHFGEPLDIEWAYANGQFHILQARPLTAIQFDTPYEWTNADLKDGGISASVTTPMMYSLYEHIFELTMPGYLGSTRVLHGKPIARWFTWWFGHCYWNLTGVKESLKKLPGFQERTFDEGLGIEPDYEGSGYTSRSTPLTLFRGIRALLATKKSIRNRPAECKEAVRKTREIFAHHEGINLDQLTTQQLLKHLHTLIHEHYTFVEGAYFFTIYDNSNAATFFQDRLRKYNKKARDPVHYLNLIAGLSNLSHLRPVFDLWDISRTIRADEEILKLYLSLDASGLGAQIIHGSTLPKQDSLRDYIHKYRHHSYKELDITVPNWDEDATQVAELLLQFLGQEDNDDPRRASQFQQQQFQTSKERLKSKRLQRELSHHRHLLWWREELRDNSSKMYNLLRKTILVVGRKLTSDGVLLHPEDVFMITFEELFALDPVNPDTSLQHKIQKNREFYRSFRNFSKPNEILHGRKTGKRGNGHAQGTSLKGIAGSAGIVQGRARVITSVYDAAHLERGEILVTPFTDPAWTSYFTIISALVTETGGVLSHGAVVSREYGIPAVLGVKEATQKIRTGDLIEVNGNEGTVIFIR